MNQIKLKALCREYVNGKISDADLLTGVQVSDETQKLLWALMAMPEFVRLRVRIEDLLPEQAPKKIKKIAGDVSEENTAYWRKLRSVLDMETAQGAFDGTRIFSRVSVDGIALVVFHIRKPVLAAALYNALKSWAEKFPAQAVILQCFSVSVPTSGHLVNVALSILEEAELMPPSALIEFTSMSKTSLRDFVTKYSVENDEEMPLWHTPELKIIVDAETYHVIFRFNITAQARVTYDALCERAGTRRAELTLTENTHTTEVRAPFWLIREAKLA